LVDVISFNIILKSTLLTGSWEDVENVLRDMRCKGFCPNKVTYNSLMNAAASRGEVNQAWKLLDRMEAEGITLDACTCSTLMKCVKISKRYADIEQVLALIERAGVELDEVLITDLLETCVRFGDKEGKLQARILQVLRSIDARPPPHVFAAAIKAYGQSGQLDQAWVLWRELTIVRQLTLDQSLFVCMVEACMSNGDLSGALQVFRALKLAFPSSPARGSIFSLVIKACLQRKQTGLAMELYEEMDQDATITCSLVTYNTLIDAFARAGDMAGVGKVFTGMCSRNVEPDLITYSTAIKGYCVRGDLETGIRLLGRMRQKGIEPDAVLYNSLLDGCAHQQLRKLTEKVLADMEGPAGIAPSNYTLSILVKLYGRCKDIDKVFEVVESYPAEYGFELNAKVYTCLMSALISNGLLTQALDVFQRMKAAGSAPDAVTYQTILNGCLKQGNISSAVMLANTAVDGGYYHLDISILQEILMATTRIGRASDLGLPLLRRLCGCGISIPARVKAAVEEGSREPKSCRSSEKNWRGSSNVQRTSVV
jgi:pentatricopeptide repeat protein